MAIAFDTLGTGSNAGGVTITWKHTVGVGANGIIFAQTLANIATGTISSIKFAGTAMTKIIAADQVGAANEVELWYLLNPPSGLGTFNGTWSANAGGENDGLSFSYFGVKQTTPILGSTSKLGTATNSGINIGLSLTGTQSWFLGVAGFDNNTGTITTGNFRGTAGNAGMLVGADNTAGTLVWSDSNAVSNWAIVAAEFAPNVDPAGTKTGYMPLMGIGK